MNVDDCHRAYFGTACRTCIFFKSYMKDYEFECVECAMARLKEHLRKRPSSSFDRNFAIGITLAMLVVTLLSAYGIGTHPGVR